jgi:hypothetical protein
MYSPRLNQAVRSVKSSRSLARILLLAVYKIGCKGPRISGTSRRAWMSRSLALIGSSPSLLSACFG